VLEDSSRTFYMSPDEAVEYGLIDKVRGNAFRTRRLQGGICC